MHSIKRNIPNFFTLLNLSCGVFIIITLIEESGLTPHMAQIFCVLIVLGAIFDFLDGFFARLLNVEGGIGKQLDSLADMLTFGIAPAIILAYLCLDSWDSFQKVHLAPTYIQGGWDLVSYPIPDTFIDILFLIFAIIIPVFCAIRLARFNVNTKNENHFKGLPTPAFALFIVGLVTIYAQKTSVMIYEPSLIRYHFNLQLFILAPLSIILPFLLISNIRLFSFKVRKTEKPFSITNICRLILILGGLILFLLFSFGAFAFIIPLYLILSRTNNILE